MKNIIFLLFSFVNLMKCSEFVWKDCGASDASIRFTSVAVSPFPIKYPGSESVQIDVTVVKDIPVEDFTFVITANKLTPYTMAIPCIKDFGSCKYDYCEYAKKETKDLYTIFAPVKCPLTANKYSFDLKDRSLPDVGDVFKKVLEGEFEANGTYINSKTGQVYGCLYGKFEVKL